MALKILKNISKPTSANVINIFKAFTFEEERETLWMSEVIKAMTITSGLSTRTKFEALGLRNTG
jgi:hypothetical protein